MFHCSIFFDINQPHATLTLTSLCAVIRTQLGFQLLADFFCSVCANQADMHGLLTFVLIPSTHSRPAPVKENVVNSESQPDSHYTKKNSLYYSFLIEQSNNDFVFLLPSAVSPPGPCKGPF